MFRIVDKDTPVQPMDLCPCFEIRCSHVDCQEPREPESFRCEFSVPETKDRLVATFKVPDHWLVAVAKAPDGAPIPFMLCPVHAAELLAQNSELAASTGVLRGMGG